MWVEGSQGIKPRIKRSEDLDRQLALEGFLEEDQAKIELYKFFENNLSVTTEMLMGVKLFEYQNIVIRTNMERDFVLNILGRGSGKSFLAAIFAGMYAIFNPGVKIGLISASFRQAKRVFQYLEEIAQKPKAELFSQCIGKIEHKSDEWSMEIGRSKIFAIPLGTGEKLRGFRFNCIVIDELLLMPERILSEVIIPFLGVVQNPTERRDLRVAEDELIKAGLLKEEDRYKWPNNKLIGLSSASFAFEYLYELYQIYENLILGKVDASNKLILDKVGKTANASRAIVHMSYEAIPSDIYDQNLLQQALSQMSESQFAREFGSVFTDDSSGYFRMSKMAACTIQDGERPNVEVKGEKGSEYLLSFDPSWAENETSDDFAIHVFKLDHEKQIGVLVHSYAVAGANLSQHIKYFSYLLQNFNIVMIWGDYNGGVEFINACNESSEFKDRNFKLQTVEEDFDKLDDYQKCLQNGKNLYSPETKKMVFLRTPTSDWIRRGNESLQGNIDHHRILFAGGCMNATFEEQIDKNIPIDSINFYSSSEMKNMPEATGKAKMIEFVERQKYCINLTKAECAMILVRSSPQGNQIFDLPENIKRQTGPNRTRKDSYSALILGNWGIKIFYELKNFTGKKFNTDFTPYAF